jgi:hypothetical protein
MRKSLFGILPEFPSLSDSPWPELRAGGGAENRSLVFI